MDIVELLENEGDLVASAEIKRLRAELAECLLERNAFQDQCISLEMKMAVMREERDELVAALELALSSHGVMLLSDPPQDAWKVMGVELKARAALAKLGAGGKGDAE